METEKALLGIVDYLIFSCMLLVSAGIGIYFRFSGGNQKTTDEYLLAGKDMSILPVAFSLMASFLSAITVIGVPAEVYQFGINMAYMNIGYVIGMILAAYISLPVFFELNASTAYEYLDRRFGKVARSFTSIFFVFQMILYISVVLYAPALALSAVTNLSTWVAIVSIGVVCTFYCTLGGMKAVLWTDVFQALLMFLGIFAVLIKGFLDVGITEVYKIAYDGGRLNFPGFETSFRQRYTIWNILVQGIVLSFISYGGNQVQIQRLLTVKNISRSRLALYVSIPMGCSFHLLNCLVGVVIYAYYASCDPLTRSGNPISSADQLLPYYMMTKLQAFPGLPGLCICGVFSASLSTVSSAVNSLTAVTMQDLLKPMLESKGMSQKKMTFAAKTITIFYGFLCILLTFLVANFGNLVQASLTVFGMLGGPVLSVFLLGMLTTRANEKGVVVGLLTSIAIAAWISFGASANAPKPTFLPVSLENCPVNSSLLHNSSSILNETVTLPLLNQPLVSMLNETAVSSATKATTDDFFSLYSLSYMWFAPIGLSVGLIVGYVCSIMINLISGETPNVPEELLSPLAKFFTHKKTNAGEKTMKITSPVELQNVNSKSIKGVRVTKCTENVINDRF